MSQGVPTGLEGQIDSPNSFELLWDRYRRWVIGIVVALVAAIGVKYLIEYFDRKATDSRWTAVAASTGLNKVYSEIDLPEFAQAQPQFFLQSMQAASVGALPEKLKELDGSKLASALADAKGDDTLEPLLLWFSGIKAIADRDYDAARSRLETLKSTYSDHFLARSSDAPAQWRPEVEDEDEDKDDKKNRRRAAKLEFEPPVSGSPVDRLLASMTAETAFRGSQKRIYEAVAPTSEQTATMTIEDPDGSFSGTVKIRFFDKQAPKHVEAFIKLVQEGDFFDGVRVHMVERARSDLPAGTDPRLLPNQLEFGYELTKTEEDRTKWTDEEAGEIPEEHQVEWEGSDELSHFPGTLSAKKVGESSQIERLIITGGDTAVRMDGSQVIFGRVIEGLELIQRIIEDAEFRTETDETAGRGAPGDDIVIKSIVIE